MASSHLRVAIVATPRCGNTWLRLMLGRLFDLEQIAVHHPRDMDWGQLPPRLVLQLHWERTPDFERQLAEHGFRLVGLHRHPLDTLISILHVSLHHVESERWLDGAGGDESSIVAAMPRSQAFLDYGTGPRARALFDLNLQWHDHPDRFSFSYEALVANPAGWLRALADWLGVEPARPIDEVAAAHSLTNIKNQYNGNGHFWKGSPGLWRSLLCPPEVGQLATALAESFARFGYRSDPDAALTPTQADANWVRLVAEERRRDTADAQTAREEADRLREFHRLALVDVEARRQELQAARSESRELARQLAESCGREQELRSAVARLTRERDDQAELAQRFDTELNQYVRLGRWPLALLRSWDAFRIHYPLLARLLRQGRAKLYPAPIERKLPEI